MRCRASAAERRWFAFITILFLAIVPGRAVAHPLHNSYSQVILNPATGAIEVTLRTFADDFSRHISGAPGGPAGGSLEIRAGKYLATAFQLTDRTGRIIPLQWCGWSRKGDQFVICLKGSAPRAGGPVAKIRNAVLMDLFADQLNIAQISTGSRHSNLLFRPATSTQSLP